MFVALAVILLVAWALGFGVFHVAGGLVHLSFRLNRGCNRFKFLRRSLKSVNLINR